MRSRWRKRIDGEERKAASVLTKVNPVSSVAEVRVSTFKIENTEHVQFRIVKNSLLFPLLSFFPLLSSVS